MGTDLLFTPHCWLQQEKLMNYGSYVRHRSVSILFSHSLEVVLHDCGLHCGTREEVLWRGYEGVDWHSFIGECHGIFLWLNPNTALYRSIRGLLIECGPIGHIVKLPISMIITLYPQLEIIWKVSKSLRKYWGKYGQISFYIISCITRDCIIVENIFLV